MLFVLTAEFLLECDVRFDLTQRKRAHFNFQFHTLKAAEPDLYRCFIHRLIHGCKTRKISASGEISELKYFINLLVIR